MKRMKIDVRAKAVFFFAYIMLSILFNDPRFLGGLFLIACGAAFTVRLPWLQFVKTLRSLLPLLILIFVVTSFNLSHTGFQLDSSQQVIYSFDFNGRWEITKGGLSLGLAYAIRIMIFVLSSLIIQTNTSLEELHLLFKWTRLPNEISFLLITALRFIPELNKKRLRITEAQKARGASIQEGGFFHIIRSFLPIVIPLFASSIQMADTLSMAMVSRGFGYTKTWTPAYKLCFRLLDYIIVLMVMVILLVALYVRIVKQWGCL